MTLWHETPSEGFVGVGDLAQAPRVLTIAAPTKSQKYDDSQPRDDSGRWTDGGGWSAGSAISSGEVRQAAGRMGFDSQSIRLAGAAKTISVGGRTARVAGEYNSSTGLITLFKVEGATREQTLGILAHEVQHAKNDAVMKRYKKERRQMTDEMLNPDGSLRSAFEAKFPTYAELQPIIEGRYDELKASGNLTDYAQQWWKVAEEFDNRRSPLDETLAEISMMKELTPDIAQAALEVRPAWRALFSAVNAQYAAIEGSAE